MATSYASHPVTHVEKHVIPGRTYTEVHPQVKIVEQPYVHQVGENVHNVPTGVSYQSSSVVHSKKVVTPILAQGVQKHVVAAEPIYKTYQEPSVVKTIATQQHVAYETPVAYQAAPVAYQAAPLAYSAYQAAPVAYSAPHAYQASYAAPHSYQASYAAPAVHYAAQAPLITKSLASPIYAKTIAAPVAYAGHGGYSSGYAHTAPVVKSVWGNAAGYATSPYSYGNAIVASPYAYGVKSAAVASPWSYGYGANAAHAW